MAKQPAIVRPKTFMFPTRHFSCFCIFEGYAVALPRFARNNAMDLLLRASQIIGGGAGWRPSHGLIADETIWPARRPKFRVPLLFDELGIKICITE